MPILVASPLCPVGRLWRIARRRSSVTHATTRGRTTGRSNRQDVPPHETSSHVSCRRRRSGHAPSMRAASRPPPRLPGTVPLHRARRSPPASPARGRSPGAPTTCSGSPNAPRAASTASTPRPARSRSPSPLPEVSAPGSQDGLLGLALHPDLLKGTGRDIVFAAYTYQDPSRPADPTVKDDRQPVPPSLRQARPADLRPRHRHAVRPGHADRRPSGRRRPQLRPAQGRAGRQALLHHRRPGERPARQRLHPDRGAAPAYRRARSPPAISSPTRASRCG